MTWLLIIWAQGQLYLLWIKESIKAVEETTGRMIQQGAQPF
jgi:hypothetical protein